MSKVHCLKTWPEFYWEVIAGNKTFEIRKDDRDFKEGDMLILQEFDPEEQKYTGEMKSFLVSHLMRNGKLFPAEGYVIMSIVPAGEGDKDYLLAEATKALEDIMREKKTLETQLRQMQAAFRENPVD